MTRCSVCGAEVQTIYAKGGPGRPVTVEYEEVWVRESPEGYIFLTATGNIIHGFAVGDAEDRPEIKLVRAYEPHEHQEADGIIRDERFDFGIRGEYFLYKDGYFVENERISKFTKDVKPVVSKGSHDRKRFPTSRRAITMAKKIGFDAWRADGYMLYRAADGMSWNV